MCFHSEGSRTTAVGQWSLILDIFIWGILLHISCAFVSFPLPASIKEVMVDVCIVFDVIIPVLFLSRSSFFSSLLCVQSATSLSSGFLFLIVALLGYLQALSCSLIPFGSHTVPSCSSANPSPDLSSLPFIPPPYLFPSPFHSQ